MPTVRGPYEFPPEAFPITLTAFGVETERELWSATIEAPEGLGALQVPPLAVIHGERVRIRVEFADGTVEE